MDDYSLVNDSTGDICGIWLCDSSKANNKNIVAMLLIKHGGNNLAESVLLGDFRIVPNSFDEKGGVFMMFGSELAPGENPADTVEPRQNQKNRGSATSITDARVFVDRRIVVGNEQKECAYCQSEVPQELIECPNCGRGIFHVPKIEKLCSSIEQTSVQKTPMRKKWWQFWKRDKDIRASQQRGSPFEKVQRASICYAVSKTQVLEMDTSFVDAAIDEKVSEIIQLDQQLSNLTGEAKIVHGVKLIDNIELTRFSISGYDDDPCPLWDFQETQHWAWTWLRKQPYCLLLLEEQSCLTLSILCLGSFKSSKYKGFIPNFRSQGADEFESLLKSSFGCLVARYGNPFILGALGLSRHASLSTQFKDMKTTGAN